MPARLNPPLLSRESGRGRGAFGQLPAESREPAPSVPIGARLSGASLLFAAGERPSVEEVQALALADLSFVVSFDPAEGGDRKASSGASRWVEILEGGFSFDLHGLAPGRSQASPASAHHYGLQPVPGAEYEAISLRPVFQSSSRAAMRPVVRGMARLTAVLAALPGVRAVNWHAARALSSPEHFRASVLRWVEGGAFPGLGLAALSGTREGGLQSEGLALFTGQDLRIAPELCRDRAAGARLALRLLHWMVEHGRLNAAVGITSPSGDALVLEPIENRRFVGVSRG